MTVNTELLERVMQHITDHPEQHNQTVWVDECGTAACFAGWACLLSGWSSTVWHDGDEHRVMSPDTLTEKSTPDVAVDLLGIGEDDAAMLFHRDNTRPALARMVKDLVNGEELRRFEDYYKEAGEEGAS